jgi:hypothetical protein
MTSVGLYFYTNLSADKAAAKNLFVKICITNVVSHIKMALFCQALIFRFPAPVAGMAQ